MKRLHKNDGFTLIELLIVVAIIGVIAAIAVPNLLRARQSGYEASAIGSIRAIHSGETAFASSCGGGGYATTNADLYAAPTGGQPFISPDLENADTVGKSGYRIIVGVNGATGGDAEVMEMSCNGATSLAMYFVAGNPISFGQTGSRYFASDQRGTIYFDFSAAFEDEIPEGTDTFIQ